MEKEVQKELEAEKPDGEQALNDLFKSIYGKVSERLSSAFEGFLLAMGPCFLRGQVLLKGGVAAFNSWPRVACDETVGALLGAITKRAHGGQPSPVFWTGVSVNPRRR